MGRYGRPPDVPETDAFTVYLIHEPSCRADWDADLILAGHTHGGQFLFPIIDQLNDHGIIELAGMFDADGTPTYISRASVAQASPTLTSGSTVGPRSS